MWIKVSGGLHVCGSRCPGGSMPTSTTSTGPPLSSTLQSWLAGEIEDLNWLFAADRDALAAMVSLCRSVDADAARLGVQVSHAHVHWGG